MATKPNHALIYRQIPGYLAGLRQAAKMTQRQPAQKIRRSQWWVARIETGSRRVDVAEFILFCQAVTPILPALCDKSNANNDPLQSAMPEN